MTTNKAKGTAFETLTVRALNAFGIGARRAVQAGRNDVGDLHGLGPWAGQCKDWRSWQDAIREGLDGVEKQRVHARVSYGVAFVKRARRPVGEAYAVQTLATWARVAKRLQRAEALLSKIDPTAYLLHAEETARELSADFPRGTAPTE